MQEQNENTKDTTAETWYNERAARVDAEKQQLEAQSTLVETTYNNLSARYDQLSAEEERAHDALDTRQIVALQEEKTRILNEGNQLREGYTALQQQREQIERGAKLDYATLHEGASEKSKLFLQVFKHRLENDPAALRRLLHADNIARAKGVPVDTNDYFAELESQLGFSKDDRRFEFENSPSKTRQVKEKAPQFTPEQIEMSRSINGVSPEEYLKAAAKPFSQAADADSHIYVDPSLDVDTGKDAMEVRFDEPAKPQPKKYRAPDPKSSVTLSPTEVAIIDNMATSTGRPLAEVRREFAENKLKLHREQAYRLSQNQNVRVMT